MNTPLTTALLALSIIAAEGQERSSVVPAAKNDEAAMLVAVSRDESMLSGGIGSSKWTSRGTVVVEVIARLTAAGEWIAIPCSSSHQEHCRKFAHEYLSKPHLYTVVSADGKGATVRAKPTSLSECFDYSGTGIYAGGTIDRSAIATNLSELFGIGGAVTVLSKTDSVPVIKLLSGYVPSELDTADHLQVMKVELEGKGFYIVQRAFADVPKDERRSLVFDIGQLMPHRFVFLIKKRNQEDEDERVLGTIRLRNGRDFLITVVNDPESHFFRVYGIRNDKLKLVYSGGGASC